jgi:hypothetical protein
MRRSSEITRNNSVLIVIKAQVRTLLYQIAYENNYHLKQFVRSTRPNNCYHRVQNCILVLEDKNYEF